MSGGDENKTNYEHIKALVRDIHVTKNVARPDQLINSTLINNHNDTSSGRSTSRSQSPMRQQWLPIELDRTMTGITILDAADKHATHQNHMDESNLIVPSVIITDSTEPLDLFQSTQRRFSQLYSGLRRLSTSHTVWNTIVKQVQKPIVAMFIVLSSISCEIYNTFR